MLIACYKTRNFVLTDKLVATKMHDYSIGKGFNEAQIAGIIGNAEAESGFDSTEDFEEFMDTLRPDCESIRLHFI